MEVKTKIQDFQTMMHICTFDFIQKSHVSELLVTLLEMLSHIT